MHQRSTFRACLAFAPMLLLALTACGDDGDDNSSTSSSSSSGAGNGGMGAGGMGAGGMGAGGMGAGGMGAGGMAAGGMGAGGMAAGGMGAGGMGAGGMGAGGNMQMRSFTLIDALSQMPAAGLSLCDHANANNCVTTNANGQADINLPDATVTVDYSGNSSSGNSYRPHLLTVRQGAGSGNITSLAISNSAVTLLGNILGFTDDNTKGHLGSAANIVGAVASLMPMSGAGPFYSDSNNIPNTQLTSTSTSGSFIYANVNPGAVEVAVTAPNANCTNALGVLGTSRNTAIADVEAGAITIVATFACQ